MELSVSKQLNGRTVLLTGGLGFVGSTLLEQLLRLTEVKSVLLLVRGRGKLTARQRVAKLLSGPLFHLLHEQTIDDAASNVFSKVCVLEGDLEAPGLGLSEGDRQLVLAETDILIHCAADLALEPHIQRTLRANYCGTRQLLELAWQMPRLRSFVHTSTYFVNAFKPFNDRVPEEVHYPTLQLAGDPNMLTHEQLVELLLSLPPDTAAAETSALMKRLGMPSTYAFGKTLTEQLIDAPTALPAHVSKAIVRPSLVHCMAGAPCPGYCTSMDGAPGYVLAYAAGFFHDIDSVAFTSDAWADVIPVDVVSSLIVAAAAAAHASSSSSSTSSSSDDSRRAVVYHATSSDSHPMLMKEAFDRLKQYWTTNPAPARLPFAKQPCYKGRHTPSVKDLRRSHRVTGIKVWAAAKLLQLTGRSRQARALRTRFEAFCLLNTPGYTRSFVSLVDNAHRLQASLSPAEAATWSCVWDRDTSLDWDTYLYTGFVGLHTSTFKVPVSSISTPVPHLYVEHKGLSDTSVMQAWMAAAEVTAGAPSAPSAAAECGPDSGQARAASASADGGSESDSCQTPPAVSSEGSLDSPSVRVRWYQDGGIEVSDTELIKKGGSVAHGVGGGVVGATN